MDVHNDKLDRELSNLEGFWALGLSPGDYSTWADYGMAGVKEKRRSRAGELADISATDLASRVSSLNVRQLASAFGLSEEVDELLPDVEQSRQFRRVATGSNVRRWTRLVFDKQREVFVALSEDGVQVAPLEVEWAGPGFPVSLINPRGWAPWKLSTIQHSIDTVARERRQSYRDCPKCGKPTAPEHFTDTDDESICMDCAEADGAVF